MFRSQESIPFYLYHIVILAIVMFCWIAVMFSYLNCSSYKPIFEFLKSCSLSSIYRLFYDPFLAFTLLPLSFMILYCFNKKRYFKVHVFFIILPGVIVLEFEHYFVEEGSFIYSRLGLVIYSMKLLLILSIQAYVFWVTKKALKY